MKLIHLFKVFLWFCVISYETNLALSAKLRCYKGCTDRFVESPLNNLTSILKSSCYKKCRYSHFYAFGYEVIANSTDATAVIKALLTLHKYNVFLLNWEKENRSAQQSAVVGYTEVVQYHIPVVGIAFALAIKSLVNAGMNPNRVHLVGHSLGAHLCGYTGRKLAENNIIIDRITGLDPAGPFFDKPVLMKPLTKYDAKFVDCIHTDNGVYGTNLSLCHTDTYISKTKENVQPGCPVGNFKLLSRNSTCSHIRCLKIYADSIYHPNTMIASFAKNFTQWLNCKGNFKNCISIGLDVDKKKRGNYFMGITNPKPPYGNGAAGIKPSYC